MWNNTHKDRKHTHTLSDIVALVITVKFSNVIVPAMMDMMMEMIEMKHTKMICSSHFCQHSTVAIYSRVYVPDMHISKSTLELKQ